MKHRPAFSWHGLGINITFTWWNIWLITGFFPFSCYCKRFWNNPVLAGSLIIRHWVTCRLSGRLYLVRTGGREELWDAESHQGCQSHTFTRTKFTRKKILLNILCVGAIHDKQRIWFLLLWIAFAYDYLNRPHLCWLSQSVIGRCLNANVFFLARSVRISQINSSEILFVTALIILAFRICLPSPFLIFLPLGTSGWVFKATL